MTRRVALLSVFALLVGCDEPLVNVTSPVHDCSKASRVSIKAENSRFNLTGTCEKVVVDGSNNMIRIEATESFELTGQSNEVAIDAADSLSSTGSDNTVTYRKGLSGPMPTYASSSGNNNSVIQATD